MSFIRLSGGKVRISGILRVTHISETSGKAINSLTRDSTSVPCLWLMTETAIKGSALLLVERTLLRLR